MIKGAVISDCTLYRYKLWRTWDQALPVLIFIMLNPSTADADLDDPTIRRCMGFSRDNGYGGIIVINLFAFRATKPDDMLAAADPVGPMNDSHLLDLIDGADDGDRFVAAWGVHGRLRDRDIEVVGTLESHGRTVYCLARTKNGDPGHPLYLRRDSVIIPLRSSEAVQEAA